MARSQVLHDGQSFELEGSLKLERKLAWSVWGDFEGVQDEKHIDPLGWRLRSQSSWFDLRHAWQSHCLTLRREKEAAYFQKLLLNHRELSRLRLPRGQRQRDWVFGGDVGLLGVQLSLGSWCLLDGLLHDASRLQTHSHFFQRLRPVRLDSQLAKCWSRKSIWNTHAVSFVAPDTKLHATPWCNDRDPHARRRHRLPQNDENRQAHSIRP